MDYVILINIYIAYRTWRFEIYNPRNNDGKSLDVSN
jgi:hypothetical protein